MSILTVQTGILKEYFKAFLRRFGLELDESLSLFVGSFEERHFQLPVH